MRIVRTLAGAGVLLIAASCQDWLAVNTNPNGPEIVTANLYLPPILSAFVGDQPNDARYFGRYVQNIYAPSTSFSTWDRMGYDAGTDNGTQLWRDTYWTLGQNLVDMIQKSEAEKRWDILGVGYLLKGWGWMQLAAVHGDIIVKEAIDQTRFSFDYDTEQYALQEARRLLDSAIVLLRRNDDAVDATYLGKGDKIYNGNRDKWRRTAFGFRAMLRNRYSNRAALYFPDSIIADVDSSYQSGADDALLQYPSTQANDDRNFIGATRGNINAYRQTKFIVELMDGTQFGVVDPRMSRMLAPAPDGVYRGLDINTLNFGALTAAQRPNNFWGYTGLAAFGAQSRYIFADKTKMPALTYAQLQFIKAEAAFRKGDKATALVAYQAGVDADFAFVNARNQDDGQVPTQISAAEITAYKANANVWPTAPANLTMWQIQTQKYITQFWWGVYEQWMDMRRFHYTDTWTGETRQVFPGFAIPANIFVDNAGKVVQRMRPRYNSEYVWNQAGLSAITPVSGLDAAYQTSTLWITDPSRP